MSDETQLVPVRATTPRGLSAVRHTVPRADMATTLRLAGQMTASARSHELVLRSVEHVTGLRHGELLALAAVAEGADHPRAVARRTGQVDDAARATVDGLLRRGVLARHHHANQHDGEEPALLHITETGAVVLEQAEALQLRMTDAVLADADGATTSTLLQIVGGAADLVRDTGRSDPPAPPVAS